MTLLVTDVAIGLPKSCGIASVSMSQSTPEVKFTQSTTPSSTTGLAVLTTAFMTLPAISPTMKSIGGRIGTDLCIRTSPLLRDYIETVSTLEKERMINDGMV